MQKKYLFGMALLLLFVQAVAAENSLQNIGVIKQRLRRYHDTGAYSRDLTREVKLAERYLLQRLKENKTSAHPKKLAIVFDIDETALSNYSKMEHLDFGGTLNQERHLYKDGKDPVIKPTLNLFKLAKQNQVAVFFVTGRPEMDRVLTVQNLHLAGYQNWDGLILENNRYHKSYQSAIPFKSQARKKIIDQGYDIVLSMGDQASDLQGGYADQTFQLPNPFYFLP